jgi:hypothetical protein
VKIETRQKVPRQQEETNGYITQRQETKKSKDRDKTKGTETTRGEDKRLYYTKTKDKKRVKMDMTKGTNKTKGEDKRLYTKEMVEEGKRQSNKVKKRHEKTTTTKGIPKKLV